METCYLCILGDEPQPVTWKVLCYGSADRRTVYACDEHYDAILHAGGAYTVVAPAQLSR